MVAHAVLHITLGEPDLNLWCEECALPSAYRVPFYNLTDRGVSSMGAVSRCTNGHPT